MIGDRWGVSDAEVRRAYGCDAFVTAPTLQAWRGVTVRAEPATVWARIRQVRLAPYSYDLVDNLGRRSPRDLRDLPEPQVGDPFTRALGRDQGRVVAVEPGRELTATIMGAHMSYAVLPREGDVRLRAQGGGSHQQVAGAGPLGRRPGDGAQAAAHPEGAGRGGPTPDGSDLAA